MFKVQIFQPQYQNGFRYATSGMNYNFRSELPQFVTHFLKFALGLNLMILSYIAELTTAG